MDGKNTSRSEPGAACKIWILEDDPDISFVLNLFLSEEGFEPTMFGCTKDFRLAMPLDLPDIFLLDVMLPDGDGLDICRSLKSDERYCHIPVVMMSAHAGSKRVNECSPDAFIAKPFDLEKVLMILNRMTSRQ